MLKWGLVGGGRGGHRATQPNSVEHVQASGRVFESIVQDQLYTSTIRVPISAVRNLIHTDVSLACILLAGVSEF